MNDSLRILVAMPCAADAPRPAAVVEREARP